MDIDNLYAHFYAQILTKFPRPIATFILKTINWFLQGILSIPNTEKIIKIIIDLVLILIFAAILQNFISINMSIIVAFIIAHSINWILATNIWSPRIKKINNIIRDDIRHNSNLMTFLTSLRRGLQEQDNIHSAAIYGSASTGKFHKESDIDIKLFRRSGFINLIRSYMFLFSIRAKANIYRFPLDIYVIDDVNKYKIKKNEIPIIFHDPNQILVRHYDKFNYFNDKFGQEFDKEYISSSHI